MPISHFPRLADLPPYVLGAVDERKTALRAQGEDVFDFGLGNPDHASPPEAVEVLRQSALDASLHRYQPSPGLPELRSAITRWYDRRYGVKLDPATEAVATIGSKEGLGHLLLAVIGAGDVVLAPDPCYPIHRFGVLFAGGHWQPVPTGPGRDALKDLDDAWHAAPRKAKLAIVNFPHNPTSATIDERAMEGIVQWARRRDLWLVSDLAYADLLFDGGRTPSALSVDGARSHVVEFFTTSKSFNMPGWRVGFCVGNAELVGALKRIKGYMDYGIFGPIQRGAAFALDHGDAFAASIRDLYRERAGVLCRGLAAAGWPVDPPLGTMFVWAPLPERFRSLGSVAFAVKLLEEARVAVAPGVAFGPGGEGYLRFGLVEEVPRIEAACRAIARSLLG
ncbi:MAG: aminotransferase class I/II-fold pyridoxal phosphate-dependent enzyme [Myxococcales bacterium]|nr:aminotransferase class I/II-fold pyridoxal phosphate-dependent enzyme [Myxococcales bacterium]